MPLTPARYRKDWPIKAVSYTVNGDTSCPKSPASGSPNPAVRIGNLSPDDKQMGVEDHSNVRLPSTLSNALHVLSSCWCAELCFYSDG